MMEGFGCGMGRMQELCSALTAAICVVGFYASRGIPQEKYGRDKASCDLYSSIPLLLFCFHLIQYPVDHNDRIFDLHSAICNLSPSNVERR